MLFYENTIIDIERLLKYSYNNEETLFDDIYDEDSSIRASNNLLNDDIKIDSKYFDRNKSSL